MNHIARQTQKEIALVIATLIISALVMWLASSIGASPRLVTISLLTAIGLLWVALLACALAFVKNIYAAFTLLLGIPLQLIVVGRSSLSVVVAATLLLGIITVARWRIMDELNKRLRYHTVTVFYSGTRWLIFSFMIIVAGLALPFFVESLRAATIAIPETAVQYLLKPAEPELQVAAQGFAPTIITIITDLINQYVENITQASPTTSALVVLTVMILVARLLVPPLTWPALLAISFIIAAARRVKFISLITQEKNVEQLVL